MKDFKFNEEISSEGKFGLTLTHVGTTKFRGKHLFRSNYTNKLEIATVNTTAHYYTYNMLLNTWLGDLHCLQKKYRVIEVMFDNPTPNVEGNKEYKMYRATYVVPARLSIRDFISSLQIEGI